MGMVMIKCPVTGKPVPTGFGMDRATFDNPTNQFTNNNVGCPHCGQTHTWSKPDAWVEGD